MNKKIGYRKTLELLIKNPGEFFIKIKELDLFKIPFSFLLFIGLIISYVMEKIDKILNAYYISELPIIMLFILIFSLSLIGFAIHVSFYNFRINRSGGKSETKQSQKLVLFSDLYIFFYSAIYFFYFIFLFSNDFENISDKFIDIIDNIYVIGAILLGLHSIYISYNGVISLYSELNKNKAKFWFIYLPGFFTILSGGFALFFT